MEAMRANGETGRYSPSGTAAKAFHFPSDDRTWEDVPKPSTRCLSVFEAIGVDALKSDWMARGDASRDPDPILQLIEDHKKAIRDMDDIIDHVSELEQCLPEEKQKSDFYCFELNIVPSDDPRWIDITRQYYEGFRKSDDIALQMLTTAPTTLAGVSALLKYATDHVDAGYLWPDKLGGIEDGDDESVVSHRRHWFFFLNRSLAEAVRRLEA
jgi:hypothetical protein